MVVSIAALTYVFADFDVRVLSELSWQIVLVMLPAVLGYGAVTLLIEAVSLMRLIDPPESFTSLTAAKIKSASYLLGILNYALGVAALTILLRRRAKRGLGESASVVRVTSAGDRVVVAGVRGGGAERRFPIGIASIGTDSPWARQVSRRWRGASRAAYVLHGAARRCAVLHAVSARRGPHQRGVLGRRGACATHGGR